MRDVSNVPSETPVDPFEARVTPHPGSNVCQQHAHQRPQGDQGHAGERLSEEKVYEYSDSERDVWII